MKKISLVFVATLALSSAAQAKCVLLSGAFKNSWLTVHLKQTGCSQFEFSVDPFPGQTFAFKIDGKETLTSEDAQCKYFSSAHWENQGSMLITVQRSVCESEGLNRIRSDAYFLDRDHDLTNQFEELDQAGAVVRHGSTTWFRE